VTANIFICGEFQKESSQCLPKYERLLGFISTGCKVQEVFLSLDAKDLYFYPSSRSWRHLPDLWYLQREFSNLLPDGLCSDENETVGFPFSLRRADHVMKFSSLGCLETTGL
jgi:hypothetical protein